MAGIELCDPSLTRAVPQRFRDEFLMIKRYTNLRLLTYLLAYYTHTSDITLQTGRHLLERIPSRPRCDISEKPTSLFCVARLCCGRGTYAVR